MRKLLGHGALRYVAVPDITASRSLTLLEFSDAIICVINEEHSQYDQGHCAVRR